MEITHEALYTLETRVGANTAELQGLRELSEGRERQLEALRERIAKLEQRLMGVVALAAAGQSLFAWFTG